jgi:hypothetical protein
MDYLLSPTGSKAIRFSVREAGGDLLAFGDNGGEFKDASVRYP